MKYAHALNVYRHLADPNITRWIHFSFKFKWMGCNKNNRFISYSGCWFGLLKFPIDDDQRRMHLLSSLDWTNWPSITGMEWRMKKCCQICVMQLLMLCWIIFRLQRYDFLQPLKMFEFKSKSNSTETNWTI